MGGGLLRYQVFVVYGVLFFGVWYAALSQDLQQQDEWIRIGIQWAPLWAIVALGLYALLSVIYGVITFHDCPEATIELEQQIKEAKLELKKRGIDTDESSRQ